MRSSWVSQRWWGHSRSSHFDEVGWRGVCGCCSRVKVIMGLQRRKRGRRGPLLTSCLPCMNDHRVVARTSACTGRHLCNHHWVVLTIGYPLGLNDTNGPMAWNQCESVSGELIKASTLLDHYCVVILHCRVKKMVEHLCNTQCVYPSHSNTHAFVHLKGALAFNAGISHRSSAFPLLIQWTNESSGKGTEQPHTQHHTLACAFKHRPFFF